MPPKQAGSNPTNQTEAPNSDPYYFLQNPLQKNSKQPTSTKSGSSSTVQRLMIFVGIIFLLVIGGVVVQSFLSRSGKEKATELINAGKQQAEVLRIAEIGSTKAKDKSILNITAITKSVIKSDQVGLIQLIGRANGSKVTPAQLTGAKNAETDKILAKAELDNKFEEQYYKALLEALAKYQQSLQSAVKQPGLKKATIDDLNKYYQNVTAILGNNK